MGAYTIKEVLQNTHMKMKNRFDYMERDVIKRVTIKEVTELSPDRTTRPQVRYEITTESYPQYAPFYTGTDRRGRKIRYQRSFQHEYDTTLTLDRLSLNTKNWKMRVGSTAKWRKTIPESQLKKPTKKTRTKWRKQLEKKYPGDKKKQSQEMKKLEDRQYRKGDYLSVGDYNAKKLGINGDWIFRLAYVFYIHGHHFGQNYYGWQSPSITNPQKIIFFPKHALRLIQFLTDKHILKDN